MLRDMVFVAAWLVFIPAALQSGVQIGVLPWAWTSLLSPNDVLHSFAAAFPFAKLAAGTALLLLLIGRGGGIRIRIGLPEVLLLSLAALSIAAQAGSPMADTAAGWDLCEKYLKVLALGFVAMSVMTDRQRMQALVLTVCLGMGYTGVAEGGKFLLSGGSHQALGGSSLGDNNHLALNILLVVPLTHHLVNVLRNRSARLAAALSGLGCMLGVVSTFSRGGFAGLALVGVSSALASKRKLLGVLAVVVLAAVGLQVVGHAWIKRIDTIQNAEEDDSFLGRVAAWKISTLAALDHPLGVGMHGIQHGEIWYQYLPQSNDLPFFPKTDPNFVVHAAHSIWFEVLGDMGFLGLFCFALLVFSSFYSAWRTRRMIKRAKRPDLDWARDLALRLQIALLAYITSGSLLSAAYYDIDYLLIALVVVLRRHVEAELRVPVRIAPPSALRWMPARLSGPRVPSAAARARSLPT